MASISLESAHGDGRRTLSLRDAREQSGFFYQKDLAQAAAINQRVLSRYEQGNPIIRGAALHLLEVMNRKRAELREQALAEEDSERAAGLRPLTLVDIDWVLGNPGRKPRPHQERDAHYSELLPGV